MFAPIIFVRMSGGQIARQSFWASVVNYSGSLLGLFTTFYVFPLVFSPAELGVTRVFIEIGALLAAVAQLGTGYSIWKFFPRFKDEHGHHGAGFWLLVIPLFGFLILGLALLGFQSQLLHFFGANAAQFEPYYLWLLPFVFFFVFNTVFETFSASLGHIIFPAFLRENVVRIALGGLGFLYYLKWIGFAQSMQWIPFVYGFVAILNLGNIVKLTTLSFRPDFGFIRSQPDLTSEFSKYTLYFFLTTLANLFVQRLDMLMVSSVKGWADSGVYAIAINMAVLIEVPTRSILQVANPKLSEALHRDDHAEVQRLYTKTSLNQFLLGAMVLLCIWLGLDAFYAFMPKGDVYQAGKMAVLLLGLGKLFVLMQGNSSAMLAFSKKYYWALSINAIAVLVALLMNRWLIPLYGLNGAALATASTWLAISIVTGLLVWRIYRMHAFHAAMRKAFLFVLLLVAWTGTVEWGWPQFETLGVLGQTLIKSATVLIPAVVLLWKFNISEDVNSLLRKAGAQLRQML